MSTLTVVIGPKTRFGRTLVERLRDREPVLLVARDATDAAELHEGVSGSVQVADGSLGELGSTVKGSGASRVRLVIAALGPVHPEQPAYDVDAPAVRRDLGLVSEVLDAGLPVQVVLVSTILALAPGEDRRYYGGWKGVVEQQVRQLVGERPAASLSVLYPGRLVDPGARVWQRVHASYARLAAVTLSLPVDRGVARLVGLDTRIWLLLRSVSFATRSLRP